MDATVQPILNSHIDRERQRIELQLDASLEMHPYRYDRRDSDHSDSFSSASRDSFIRDRKPMQDTFSSDDDTVEYPRSAAVHMRQLDDFARYDTQRSPTPVLGRARGSARPLSRTDRGDSFADGLSGFASPASTAHHHVSRMTLGAGGIFENTSKPRRKTSGKENQSADEYDPERPVAKLVDELERMDRKTSRVDAFSAQPKSSNIFSDSPKRTALQSHQSHQSTHLQPPTRHQHRPVQPSPLRSLVVPSPDVSRSQSKSREASVFDRYQPRVEDEDEEPVRRTCVRAEYQKPSTSQTAQKSTSPKTSPPSASAPVPPPRVRVVSNPETKAATHRAEVSLADMTRLTGMLGTPTKGVVHDVVPDDGPLRESGNRINHNLKAIYARLHSLEDETTMSRRRIRELEMDLENNARERARDRELREQIEQRNVVLETEKRGKSSNTSSPHLPDPSLELEKLVVVLRREVAKVTQEWHAEMEQTKQLQARLDNMRSSPRRNNSARGLDTMMDGLIQRIGQLENEVGKLRSVVERAVELKDATFDGERTMRQDDVPRPTQYQEGLVAAAYEDSSPAFARTEQVLVQKPLTPPPSDEDAQISPSPSGGRSHSEYPASKPSRRLRRKDTRIHDSRSDEPQDDPAASPFPSIRGERLEKEFFSPLQKVRAGKPSSPRNPEHESDRPTREQHDQHRTEAYPAPLGLDSLDQALRRNDGKLPPQTLVMSVLREIEDDYQHYLGIYTDLAEQYKRMSPLSIKRHILAEHLKEVIDTMELKANQVARLTEVLQVKDKHFTAPVIKAAQASKARMSVPETVRAVRKDLGKSIVSTPLPKRRQEHAVV